MKNGPKDLKVGSHPRTAFSSKRVSLLVCVLLASCNKGRTGSAPQIVFIKVPVADVGGPETTDTIEGRVSGVRADQRIVLYARSEGRWWVQPLVETPFTKIQGDSTWENNTHLGTDYAALLVNPGYEPPPSPDKRQRLSECDTPGTWRGLSRVFAEIRRRGNRCRRWPVLTTSRVVSAQCTALVHWCWCEKVVVSSEKSSGIDMRLPQPN